MPWRIVKAAQLRANEIRNKYYLGNKKCCTNSKYKNYISSYFLDKYCDTVISDIELDQTSVDVITDINILTCVTTVASITTLDDLYNNDSCGLTITPL